MVALNEVEANVVALSSITDLLEIRQADVVADRPKAPTRAAQDRTFEGSEKCPVM